MSDLLETHSKAWRRQYDWRRSGKHSWMSDKEAPIRMRGYSELQFVNIPPKLRKKLDSALKRGYALENSTQLPILLRIVKHFCPVANVPIGYIGKTEMKLYLPTEEDAIDLQNELRAQTVMTEAFDGGKVAHAPQWNWRDWHCVHVRAQRKGAKGQSAHLVSTFKEMRPAIDEWMAKEASVREDIARWAADDATVIRIPFDSHKER